MDLFICFTPVTASYSQSLKITNSTKQDFPKNKYSFQNTDHVRQGSVTFSSPRSANGLFIRSLKGTEKIMHFFILKVRTWKDQSNEIIMLSLALVRY